MKNTDMSAAPRDRNILVQTKTFGFNTRLMDYEVTGTQWVEAWWLNGKWVEWRGRKTTLSTSHIDPVAWAELPQ